MMGNALQNLGDQPVYTLYKAGTEDNNGTVSNLVSILVVRDIDPNPGAFDYRMEYRTYRNGSLVSRAAVDGARIWHYTVAGNSYSSFTYNQLAYADRATAMFRTLSKLIVGEDQILVQTAQQAYEASLNGQAYAANKWLPWMPVSQIVSEVPNQTYQFLSQVPNTRSVTYNATENPPGYYSLTNITGRTSANRGGVIVKNDWSITIDSNEIAGTDYTFNPPAGSRAIANSLVQGG